MFQLLICLEINRLGREHLEHRFSSQVFQARSSDFPSSLGLEHRFPTPGVPRTFASYIVKHFFVNISTFSAKSLFEKCSLRDLEPLSIQPSPKTSPKPYPGTRPPRTVLRWLWKTTCTKPNPWKAASQRCLEGFGATLARCPISFI